MEKKVSVKLKFLFLIIAIICIMTAILGSFSNVEVKAVKNTESFENFEQLPENSSDTGSEFVKFDAYFESTDGKKYRGIRQELNEQVVLKTTLTVQTEGQLQNAQISWESNGNFSMIKNISTDDQIRSVSGNSIYFNTINNGTTKPIDLTFEQKVFDTFMDTFNVNLLSRTNKLTFSGNYIDKSGQTQKIKKEIEFRIDWYGSIDYEYEYGFWCYAEDNLFIVDEKEEKVYLVYNPWAFTKTGDTDTVMAPDAGLVISGTAPSIGGQYPTAIHVNDMSTYKKNIKEQSYDKSTGELKISIENPLSDAGKGYVIYGEQWYFTNIVMEYPIEVYDEIEATTNNIDFTASAYLEGWSTNINGEREKVQSKEKSVTMSVDVKNPKGSVLLYNIDIDESLLSKTNSRLIYDKNVDMKVNYKVDWNLDFYLYDEKIEKFVFAEDYSNAKNVLDEAYEEDTDHFADSDGNFYDMDPFIHYEGIRVSETTFDVLGENGIVYVYDADSDKVVKEIRYTDANELIKYDTPIEHIRIETSKPVSTGNIKIEHIKNIDNQILKTEHDKDEFEKFVKLYSTLHGLVKYSDEAKLTSINGDVKNVDYREGSTSYYPEFDKENYTFDPQKLNKNTMIIHFFAGDSDIDRQFTAWVNPTLYIEFPDNFTKVSYSSFSTSRVNVKVKKVKIEKIENHIVMKIETEGIITSNSDSLLKFQSLVENPTLESADRIRVFGYNSICEYYDVAYLGSSEYVDDIYDIDGDSNKNEKTRIEKPVIYYAQTDNLVTKTQITDFDELGSIVEGPNIASIIPSASGNKARVNILVSNGYSNPITGTVIVGRIPFVGNDHVINSSIELGSEFSTTMEETGIKIDENYKQNLSYKVYYSTDENATKDGSEWEEHPTDWENIKSYKIEISSEVPAKSNFSFYYWIDLPEKLSYGQKTYADHAIYFHSKGTSSETSTEPDKVGLQIGGQKYKLKISDYKFKTESLIPNATETVTNAEATFQIKGENLGEDWNNDKVTGNNPAVYDDLYVGAVYTVHQSKISDPYIRDENEIKFRLTTDLNGDLVFEILDEEEKTKEFIKATEIEDPESDVPTVRLDVQNKYKYNIVVENKVKGSEDYITGSKIKVEGEKQEKEDNIKVAEDGKATWENELEDTWTVTQEEVGNNKYVKDDKEHKFTVSRDEDGKIKLENLSELDDTTIRIENNDYEHQPTVYVIIENTYEAADIIATKTAKLILAEDEEERTYAVAGDFIEYTITVTNNGNKEGTAKIKDEIPAGTEFVDKSIKIEDSDNQVQVKLDGTDYTQQDLINGIDVTLEAGKSKTLTFRVKVLPLNEEETEREIINTAHIEDNDEEPGEDPTDDPKDNPTSEPIKEYASDLKVSKINNPDSETAVKVNKLDTLEQISELKITE